MEISIIWQREKCNAPVSHNLLTNYITQVRAARFWPIRWSFSVVTSRAGWLGSV